MLGLQLESGEVAGHVFANRTGIQNVGAGMRIKYSLLQMGFLSILYTTTTPIPSCTDRDFFVKNPSSSSVKKIIHQGICRISNRVQLQDGPELHH
jgi:hypothetical protein